MPWKSNENVGRYFSVLRMLRKCEDSHTVKNKVLTEKRAHEADDFFFFNEMPWISKHEFCTSKQLVHEASIKLSIGSTMYSPPTIHSQNLTLVYLPFRSVFIFVGGELGWLYRTTLHHFGCPEIQPRRCLEREGMTTSNTPKFKLHCINEKESLTQHFMQIPFFATSRSTFFNIGKNADDPRNEKMREHLFYTLVTL